MNASFVLPLREFDTRASALLFGAQHRSLIFLRATHTLQRDPIYRNKVGQKSFFERVVLKAPYPREIFDELPL